MASSYELRQERQKYYNLLDVVNATARSLSKAPEEIEDADSYLFSNYKIDDDKMDGGELQDCLAKVKNCISGINSHISAIESKISQLSNQITQAEIREAAERRRKEEEEEERRRKELEDD